LAHQQLDAGFAPFASCTLQNNSMNKKELADLIWKAGLLVTFVALVLVEWQRGQQPVRCEVTINGGQYEELTARLDEISKDVHDSADYLSELDDSATAR